VVWFGEALPTDVLDKVDAFINPPSPSDNQKIDLIMVIGTSAKVYPAAGYITAARRKGARVCVVNVDEEDRPPGGWREGEFFFQGDAAVLVPKMLEPVIGELGA
ncbi:hypothetical protein LTR53_019910, partial [Teratosphaeriaceae sp. CCFEE 6253]